MIDDVQFSNGIKFEMQRGGEVNVERLLADFAQIEETTAELTAKNSFLEVKLDEVSRLMKLTQTKEKYLKEERDGLLHTVLGLQQAIQNQCDLRWENENLKSTLLVMEKEFQARIEEGKACVEKLRKDLCDLEDRRQQEVRDLRQDLLDRAEVKESEVRALRELKDSELDQMRKTMRDQERKNQNELLKLQMEFSARLARVQASFQGQKQPQVTLPVSREVFQRKLQSLQEERSREVAGLRQQVAELQQQLSKQARQSKRRKL